MVERMASSHFQEETIFSVSKPSKQQLFLIFRSRISLDLELSVSNQGNHQICRFRQSYHHSAASTVHLSFLRSLVPVFPRITQCSLPSLCRSSRFHCNLVASIIPTTVCAGTMISQYSSGLALPNCIISITHNTYVPINTEAAAAALSRPLSFHDVRRSCSAGES
jgi:hypothetical protein